MKSSELLSSHKSFASPLPLGNGRALIFVNGTSIPAIGNYETVFASLFADFEDKYFECKTTKGSLSLSVMHELYTSSLDSPDARVCDLLLPCKDIFIRSVESNVALSFKLLIPDGVKATYNQRYKIGRTLTPSLTLDVGTRRVMLFTLGDAMISPCNKRITYVNFSPGEAKIIAVYGGLNECATLSAYAKREFSLQNIADINSLGLSLGRKIFDGIKPSYRQSAHILMAMQKENGGLIASFSERYISAGAANAIVNAFIKLKLYENARRVIVFFLDRYKESSGFASRYSDTSPLSSENAFASSLSVVKAIFSYADRCDVGILRVAHKFIRDTINASIKAISSSSLPASSDHFVFRSGMLDSSHIFDGIVFSTLDFISVSKKFISYYGEDEIASLRSILSTIEEKFPTSFIDNGRCRINHLCSGAIRKPRFTFGVCPICLEEHGINELTSLEASKSGGYLCADHLASLQNGFVADLAKACVSTEAYISVLLSDFSTFCDMPDYEKIINECRLSNISGRLIALLYMAVKKQNSPLKASVKKMLSEASDAYGGYYSRYSSLSPESSPLDTEVTALALVALCD